jgi:hypothetical protein
MIGWGLADFFAKRTIDLIGDLPTLLWGHVLGAISITVVGLVYLLISGSATDLPTRAIEWLGLVLFGAGQAGVYLRRESAGNVADGRESVTGSLSRVSRAGMS